MKLKDFIRIFVCNDHGMALVTTLLLALIGMLMVISLYYIVQTGMSTSGSQKRYRIALESAHGGLNIFAKEVIQRGIQGTNLSAMGTYGGLMTPTSSDTAFQSKLTTTGSSTTNDVNFSFTFPSPSPNMTVTASLANTVKGNSSTSSRTLESGGVTEGSGGGGPQHFPYLYQINVQAQSATNPRERADLSAVYAY